MNLTEEIVENLAVEVCGKSKVTYQNQEINFARPWRRVPMHKLVEEATGIDFHKYQKKESISIAKQALIDKFPKLEDNADLRKSQSIGNIVNFCFEEFCENQLIQPTFVTDYPVEISPLAKLHRDNPTNQEENILTERFEVFCYGREIANAFSELTDPIDQRGRFEKQAAKKLEGDLEAC